MKSTFNIEDEKKFIYEINHTIEFIEEAWKNFVLCNFNNAMQYFNNIVISLDKIINYMNKYSELNLEINYLLKILQKLEKSIIIKNYVYSADLLKYEIEPILKKWKNI